MQTSCRKLMNFSPDVFCAIDRNGKLVQISAASKELWGYEPRELKGRRYIDLVIEEDRSITLQIADSIIQGKVVRNFQNHYRCKDGSIKPVSWSAQWVAQEQLMICVARDGSIDSFGNTIASLIQESEEWANIYETPEYIEGGRTSEEIRRLCLVAEETVNAVILYDADGKIIWVNKAFSLITGYSSKEVLGRKVGNVFQGPPSRAVTLNYLENCISAGQAFNFEIASYDRSGHLFWLDVKGKPVLNAKGETMYTFCIAIDITVKKEIEQSLRLSEQRYKTLFFKSPTPKWICDAQSLRFTEVNDAAIKLYGYSKAEFLSLTLFDLIEPGRHEALKIIGGKLLSEEQACYHDRMSHLKRDGSEFWVEVFAHPIELNTGIHLFFIVYDLTESRQWARRMDEQQNLYQRELSRAVLATQEKERSEIGKELHDNINQMLAAAKLYIENTKYYPERSAEFLQKSEDLVNQSIQEIRKLSRSLVTPGFGAAHFKDALADLFHSYLDLKIFEVRWSMEFSEYDLPGELQLALYRILQEAFTNTIKYAGASQVNITIMQAARELALEFSDNGNGFDDTQVKKGLGLCNIRSRAEALQGTVQIHTAPGKGCKIQVVFPVGNEKDRHA